MAVKSPRTWRTAANQVVTWTHIPDHPRSKWGEFGFVECTGCLQAEGGDPEDMLDTGDAARHANVCREFQSK